MTAEAFDGSDFAAHHLFAVDVWSFATTLLQLLNPNTQQELTLEVCVATVVPVNCADADWTDTDGDGRTNFVAIFRVSLVTPLKKTYTDMRNKPRVVIKVRIKYVTLKCSFAMYMYVGDIPWCCR